MLAIPTQGRLVTRKLTDYKLGLYASPSYLTFAPAIRTTADLRGHRFINYIDDLIFTAELDYLDEAARHYESVLAATQQRNIRHFSTIARDLAFLEAFGNGGKRKWAGAPEPSPVQPPLSIHAPGFMAGHHVCPLFRGVHFGSACFRIMSDMRNPD